MLSCSFYVLHSMSQVVADEERARRISYARSQRADEFRHLQSMAALHAQRAKEFDHVSV